MRVNFKLYAGLAQYLPPGTKNNALSVELADGQSINTLIERYHVPPDQAHLVLLNGVYQDRQARDAQPLVEGDTIAIWPPVAGG